MTDPRITAALLREYSASHSVPEGRARLLDRAAAQIDELQSKLHSLQSYYARWICKEIGDQELLSACAVILSEDHEEPVVEAAACDTSPVVSPETADQDIQEQQHPEATCQDCGGPNVVWFAANELWNKVMGGPDGVVCPVCFVQRAEALGLNHAAWELRQEVSDDTFVVERLAPESTG